MRVAATIVYVADVGASLAFYEQAFGFAPAFRAPDDSYAALGGDGAGLSFAAHAMAPEAERRGDAPAGFEVWVETTDVAAALARAVEAGATLVREPVEKPWGQTVAYARAPDGVLIELGTPSP